jgi:hypothetical protein
VQNRKVLQIHNKPVGNHSQYDAEEFGQRLRRDVLRTASMDKTEEELVVEEERYLLRDLAGPWSSRNPISVATMVCSALYKLRGLFNRIRQ